MLYGGRSVWFCVILHYGDRFRGLDRRRGSFVDVIWLREGD